MVDGGELGSSRSGGGNELAPDPGGASACGERCSAANFLWTLLPTASLERKMVNARWRQFWDCGR